VSGRPHVTFAELLDGFLLNLVTVTADFSEKNVIVRIGCFEGMEWERARIGSIWLR